MGRNRQSKDFGEIVNIQTDLNISNKKWSSIFHNWEDPCKCIPNTQLSGCDVCDHLKRHGWAYRGDKMYGENIIVIGDIHGSFDKVRNLMSENPDVSHWYTTGDIDVKVEDLPKEPLPQPLISLIGCHEDFGNIPHSEKLQDFNLSYLGKFHGKLEINNFSFYLINGIDNKKYKHLLNSELEGEKIRFITNEDIGSLMEAKRFEATAIISYQAATHMLPVSRGNYPQIKVDEGSPNITRITRHIAPRYFIHGHHHVTYTKDIGYAKTKEFSRNIPIKVFGLGNLNKNKNAFIKINSFTGEVIK